MSGSSTSLFGAPVLVTGASGFIGSHLVDSLLDEGADVRVLVRGSSSNPQDRLAFLQADRRSEVDVRVGDIRDEAVVRSVTRGVERVFHLAGLGAVGDSFRDPLSCIDVNLSGAVNVMHAAVGAGVGGFTLLSSSEVYAPGADRIAETWPVLPRSPYAGAKAAIEELARSFEQAYGLSTTIVRSFNVYGPRQPDRNLIPTAFRLLDRGEPFRVTAVDCYRDYVYVSDVVEALLALARAGEAGSGTFNVGSGVGTEVIDVVRLVGSILAIEPEIIIDLTSNTEGVGTSQRRIADTTALRHATGWTPQHDLMQGLRRTAAHWQGAACAEVPSVRVG